MSEADKKPALVDMAPAVASFLAVKDEEELVRRIPFVICPNPS